MISWLSCSYKKQRKLQRSFRNRFSLLQMKSAKYGSKTLRYFGLNIWYIVPTSDIKKSKTFPELTKIIKS